MDNDRTQQMPKVKVSSTTSEEKPKSFIGAATRDLLVYALMIVVIGAAIFIIGYVIIEHAWPFVQRGALTYPLEAGVLIGVSSVMSFYAGFYFRGRR
jgi:preprotein translocase subunit SecF